MVVYRDFQSNVEYAVFSISAFSFIILCNVIIVFYSKNLHKNLTNQFVMQLIISEMLNNINHITQGIPFLMGKINEKYNERMRVCYSQMFITTFSNLYTLYSSFLIAFRINDLLAHRSHVFKKPINIKIAKLSSLYVSLILSYILWSVHMIGFQSFSSKSQKYFRILTCWISSSVDYVILGIFLFFILLIFVYSCKSLTFIRKYRMRLQGDDDDDEEDEDNKSDLTNTEQFKKIRFVQKRLIVYPIVTAILYILIIIYRVISYNAKFDDTKKFICLVLYGVTTVFRGIIFVVIYFGTQRVFREGLYDYIMCRRRKLEEISMESLTKLDDLPED